MLYTKWARFICWHRWYGVGTGGCGDAEWGPCACPGAGPRLYLALDNTPP